MTLNEAVAKSGRVLNRRSLATLGFVLASASLFMGSGGINEIGMASTQIDVLKPAPVDGERTYGYLKQLCAFGPRKAGSEANAAQRQFVVEHFITCGATVVEQKFKGLDRLNPHRPAQVEMVNVVASWFPKRTERIVIAAHYDTRPFPDADPNPERRHAAFIGANDGASGVAVLMEIANHLNNMPTSWGVDLVLFDGEELVYHTSKPPKIEDYFLGSKEFSKRYKAHKRDAPKGYRYHGGFVLDMVGDKDLTISKEPGSMKAAGRFLVPQIWQIAAELNASGFLDQVGDVAVQDDHLPMNNAGIPTIDIIDFEYPQWHTADDLPEHCSAESLGQVGRVITAWLNLPKPKPAHR